MGKELEIQPQLETIRNRIVGTRNFKASTRATSPTEERLIDAIRGTPAARSDILTSSEDIGELEKTVNHARSLLFSVGKNFIEHPEYQELNPAFKTPDSEEDYRNNYWYTIGEHRLYILEALPEMFNIVPGVQPDSLLRSYIAPYEISADKTKPKSNPDLDTAGAKLRLRAIDGKNNIYIKIGFDDTYVLEIDYFDDENWDKRRTAYSQPSELTYTSDLSLSSMTQEEHGIIEHYIKRFITHAGER